MFARIPKLGSYYIFVFKVDRNEIQQVASENGLFWCLQGNWPGIDCRALGSQLSQVACLCVCLSDGPLSLSLPWVTNNSFASYGKSISTLAFFGVGGTAE